MGAGSARSAAQFRRTVVSTPHHSASVAPATAPHPAAAEPATPAPAASPSTAEIEDFVTLRDVMTVAQRLEMVRRISEEIESYIVELGTEGVQNIPALPKLTAEEQKLLDACLPDRLVDDVVHGLLHDLGKIGIPEAILNKPGKLTDSEFGTMRRHPEAGAAHGGS